MVAWMEQLILFEQEANNLVNLMNAIQNLEDIDALVDLYESSSRDSSLSTLYHTYHKLTHISSASVNLWKKSRQRKLDDILNQMRHLLDTCIMLQVDDYLAKNRLIYLSTDNALIHCPLEASFLYLLTELMPPTQIKLALSKICEKILKELSGAYDAFALGGLPYKSIRIFLLAIR
jgi:hypothetical protein